VPTRAQANRVELTPLRFLERAAAAFGAREAVVSSGRRISYADLQGRAHRLAGALRAAGLQPGDRVAVLMPNSLALLEAHFGVPLAGCVLVAINTRLAPAEVAYILRHAGARALLVDAEWTAQVANAISECPDLSRIVVVAAPGVDSSLAGVDYDDFLANAQPFAMFPQSEDDPISINYTSGTTGRPRGALYTHRGAYLNAISVAFETQLGPESVYLWTLPMFHCNGWCFPWGVTAAGARHVTLRKVEPSHVWDLIASERVTHFCAAPTVLIALANDDAARPIRDGRLVRCATGGAPPSPTTIAHMASLGVQITHLYGLTETYGPSLSCAWWPEWTSLPSDEQARLKARQGVPHTGIGDVRVVGPEMDDVPSDGQTLGELVVRSNTVMAGYFDDVLATDEAFRGGWFHTGDLGVRHPDGYIELRDRAKDVIISGGENVSTVEVEQVIMRHPSVMEVAVVGVPDETWGEVPKAFVTLKPGAHATDADIVEFCRAHLARFKAPRSVVFGELPKTSTGKIQKFVLRDREWQGRAKRIN
jgi:fatty-acyl-CoA synthase